MIIFLHGQDSFRSSRKLNEIINRHQETHRSGLNLKYFDLRKSSFEDCRDQFQIRSMFKEKKLFVLKNAFSNSDFKQKFLQTAQKFLDSANILLFYESGPVKSEDPLFIFLEKKAKSQKFEPLKGKGLETWLGKELKTYNCQITFPAKQLLLKNIGADLWRLANEVQKLTNYKEKIKMIEIEDINIMVRPKAEPQIFKTIDLIANKEKDEALILLHQHLEKGDSPLYLLAMVAFQFRNLLVIKDQILSQRPIQELGWHPFLARKTSQLSQRFTFEQLKKIYQRIIQIDLDVKTGKIDPVMGLEFLIARI